MRELRSLDLFDGSAMEEGGRRVEVAVRRDCHLLTIERPAEKPRERKVRQRPIPARPPLAAIERRNSRNRDERHASGLKRRTNLLDGGGHVENQVQHLGKDHAIERPLRQHVLIGEVADDGCFTVTGVDVEDVLLHNSIGAEAMRVGVVADLENASADVGGMLLKEGLDVMAVDRRSAAVTELGAERRHARGAVARHHVPAAGAAQGCSEPIDNRAERHPRSISRKRLTSQFPARSLGSAQMSLRELTNPSPVAQAQVYPACLTASTLASSRSPNG